MATAPFAKVRGLPGLGSLLPISHDALSFFTRVLRNHGDRIRLKVLGRNVLLLSHPTDIEDVLVRDKDSYGQSQEIRSLRPIFGNGLLASEGQLWRRQRSLIQPSFQHDSLRKYSALMIGVIEQVLGAWRPGEVRNIHAEMMRYTREVICGVLFSDTIPNDEALSEAVDTVFGNLRSEVLYLPLWRRLPLRQSRNWNRAVKTLNTSIRRAIELRRASQTEGEDLLGVLLKTRDADGEMEDQQILDEILTFFLAGHETAALSLTWACALLSLHPEAQDRIAREVAVVSEGCGLTPEHVTRLPWTAAVLKEALRLYPPVWSLGRRALRDTVLAGRPVRQDTDVWICLYYVQRDERWFSEPERFLPERWIAQPSPKPFTYLPFGIGPRVCIGQHLASAEAILALASIVSRFKLSTLPDQIFTPSAWITLRPKRPVMLSLSLRTSDTPT